MKRGQHNRRKWLGLTVQERFDSGYQAIPIAGCWIWEGALIHGYGIINIDGHIKKTHRLSWELANGRPVPPGMYVCHKCDVRCCVNPDHLFIGTHIDNMNDAARKGIRKNPPLKRGTDQHLAKLSVEQVLAIRKLFDTGERQNAIAATFGISESNVRFIGRRQTWRHI